MVAGCKFLTDGCQRPPYKRKNLYRILIADISSSAESRPISNCENYNGIHVIIKKIFF